MFEAIRGGDTAACRAELAAGFDLSLGDFESGKMALHLAASYGHTEICQMLLDAGANVNAFIFDEYSPLHEAAAADAVETCRVLLAAGADRYALASGRYDGRVINLTAFQTAVALGHGCVVQMFVSELGEDIKQLTERGKPLLELAETADMKALLLSMRSANAVNVALSAMKGGDAMPKRATGMTPL